ncbi:MAG: hypothetical protein PHN78_00415 [Dehalococcoidales bacterium]|nr:hypothetical protein [Dehalococcoidales bacterium]
MKLSILQIALGIGILLAMTLSIAWDPTGFHIRESLGEPGSWRTIFNPDTREVLATVLAFLVLLLGLAIIGVSIVLLTMKIRSNYIELNSEMNTSVKKLVITQMGLTFLVAVSTFMVTIWGFPTSYTYPTSDDLIHRVFFTPGHQFVLAQTLSGISFLIGLVSLGCSITQCRLARMSKVSALPSINLSVDEKNKTKSV